jgi:hypothetical protein
MSKLFALKLTCVLTVVIAWMGLTRVFAAEETWTGRLSDSLCAASHQTRAASEKLTDRQCVIECIKALGNYVLVDDSQKVIPIVNQDFPGLPFRSGRPVKLTGEWKGNGIVISNIEQIPSQ